MRLAVLLTVLFSWTASYAQQDPRDSLADPLYQFVALPSGDIWAIDIDRYVYHTSNKQNSWSIQAIPNSRNEEFSFIDCFDNSFLLITGNEFESPQKNFIYRSTNGGRTWQKSYYGGRAPQRATATASNGSMWIAEDGDKIYSSANHGSTWTNRPSPSPRTRSIHFMSDGRSGVAGNSDNELYVTKDNCKTWGRLPTPLDQHRYQRKERAYAPAGFLKVRVTHDLILVNQDGHVFSSERGHIDWKSLEDVDDFEVTRSGQSYLMHMDRSIALIDRTGILLSKWRGVDFFARKITVSEEDLWIEAPKRIYQIHNNSLHELIKVNDATKTSPKFLINVNGVPFGLHWAWNGQYQYYLLRQDHNSTWSVVATVPFRVGSAVKNGNNIIISDALLKDFHQLDPESGAISKYEMPDRLLDLSKNPIKELHIEYGSNGCFHHDNKRKIWIRKRDIFSDDSTYISSNKGDFLKNAPGTISVAAVNQLAEEVDRSRSIRLGLKDLQLDSTDLARYHQIMRLLRKVDVADDLKSKRKFFEPEVRNADLKFFVTDTDTIQTLSDDFIDRIFRTPEGNSSTNQKFRRLIFVLNDGKNVIVENSNLKPSFGFTPWIIDVDGLKYSSNSLKLAPMINALTHEDFLDTITSDRSFAIFRMMDYIYTSRFTDRDW